MHPGAAESSATCASPRALQQVWFSALIGWVGGVDQPERVGDDLEAATRLLLGRE